MKISANSKFEIGQVVVIKGSKTRFLILDIMVQRCYGGTQVNYMGYPLYPGDRYSLSRESGHVALPKEGHVIMCETALEKLVEEKEPKKDPRLMKLMDKVGKKV